MFVRAWVCTCACVRLRSCHGIVMNDDCVASAAFMQRAATHSLFPRTRCPFLRTSWHLDSLGGQTWLHWSEWSHGFIVVPFAFAIALVRVGSINDAHDLSSCPLPLVSCSFLLWSRVWMCSGVRGQSCGHDLLHLGLSLRVRADALPPSLAL